MTGFEISTALNHLKSKLVAKISDFFDTSLNLQLFNVTRKDFEMMDCQPHEALASILCLVEKMYNYIIATRGVFELGSITYKAIEHYLRVSSTIFQ
jgi:hypothetical protein